MLIKSQYQQLTGQKGRICLDMKTRVSKGSKGRAKTKPPEVLGLISSSIFPLVKNRGTARVVSWCMVQLDDELLR